MLDLCGHRPNTALNKHDLPIHVMARNKEKYSPNVAQSLKRFKAKNKSKLDK